jgi:hypothetical protein
MGTREISNGRRSFLDPHSKNKSSHGSGIARRREGACEYVCGVERNRDEISTNRQRDRQSYRALAQIIRHDTKIGQRWSSPLLVVQPVRDEIE